MSNRQFRLIQLGIALTQWPAVAGAQGATLPPAARESAALEGLRSRLTVALASLVYWTDSRSESAVGECQVRHVGFCAANHNAASASLSVGAGVMIAPAAIRPKSWPVNTVPLDSVVPLLREGAAAARDNGWFVGQLAHTFVAQGSYEDATTVLRDCRGDRAWCLALDGYVAHTQWRFVDAEALYARALAAMSPERRCRWRDVAPLLEGETRREYAAAGCEGRLALEERVWRLADPLYMLFGNDRKTEHFSRLVLDSLLAGSLSPFGHPWNADLGRMLLRFGLPSHWIVEPDWAHYDTPTYHFIPSPRALTGGALVDPNHWSLTAPMGAVRERYRPPYGHVAELTQAQVVAFARGDSMLIAAALGLEHEPIGVTAPFVGALAIVDDSVSAPRVEGFSLATDRGTFIAKAARRNTLVSLEAMSREWQVAGRLRFTLEPPPSPTTAGLSSLALFSPGGATPVTVEQVAKKMLGSDVLVRSEPLGVFWEAYRFRSDIAATITISVTPLRVPLSFLTRIGRALGLAAKPGNVLVRWTVPAMTSGEGAGHSVAVSLGELALGTYQLMVSVATADGTRANSSRTIEVVARRPDVAAIEDALAQSVPRAGSSTPQAELRRRDVPIPPPSS